jgi:hypothetical protein
MLSGELSFVDCYGLFLVTFGDFFPSQLHSIRIVFRRSKSKAVTEVLVLVLSGFPPGHYLWSDQALAFWAWHARWFVLLRLA